MRIPPFLSLSSSAVDLGTWQPNQTTVLSTATASQDLRRSLFFLHRLYLHPSCTFPPAIFVPFPL
jgi:hypothetical protein